MRITGAYSVVQNNMKIKTMIIGAIAFWAYVALCLYIMGKLAGAI